MSDQQPSDKPAANAEQHPAWLVLFLGLLGWQAWMTLALFDVHRPWQRIRDDGPILTGRHPLHLYHGTLGARTLLERGTLSCYDPAFHAGYPKTPVFDGGSRPAELALALVGGRYSPMAYKVCQVVICLLAPLLLFLAARAAGLPRATASLAVAFALLAWWSRPGREAIESGDTDVLLAALCGLAQLGLLIRYHLQPGFFSLLGVVLCGLAGWFAQPLVMVVLVPLFLVYYLSAGHRHRLIWHLPLLAGLAVAIGANSFWLRDWVQYWWLRVPPSAEQPVGVGPGFASVWGNGFDRLCLAAIVTLALAGLVPLYARKRRLTARLTGLGMLGLVALVLASTRSHLLARMGAGQLLIPALLFASVPAAAAVVWVLERTRRLGGIASVPLVPAGVIVVIWLVLPAPAREWGERMIRPEPLRIGLSVERRALLDAVAKQTSNDARILWEDHKGNRHECRWTALLPVLVDRSFVGGLDDGAGIEHATCGLVDSVLAGRCLSEWSDAELIDYCRRYNVGWVVCGESSLARFAKWTGVGSKEALPVGPDGKRWLLRVERKASYALEGAATWRSANERGILLANVTPAKVTGEEEGQVVLSLHYQAGMRVSPSRVRIEKAVDPQDNVPFVRLRMKEPVGRILITWGGR